MSSKRTSHPDVEAEVPNWWTLQSSEVLERLKADVNGLSSREAETRLLQFGANRLSAADKTHPLRIFLHQLASPLIYVLLVAMVISLGIAWLESTVSHIYDAIVIGIVLVLNGTIGFFQEYRAENTIMALMRMISPQATVLRDNERLEIDCDRLVPGDIVLLESGDQVPADLRLLETFRLDCDEAMLTGESLPASKSAAPITGDATLPVADRRNLAFMGSMVATGRGRGVVFATGPATQIGAIAGEIRSTKRSETPLQGRMRRFSARISAAIVGFSIIAFAIGWLRGEDLATMFLTTVAIAVSAIPEGLPVVMTVALAVSVRRMARRQVLVRKLAAIETLGSCTIIVSDKTGTLTENQMTVQEIVCDGESFVVGGLGLDSRGEIERAGSRVDIQRETPLHQTLIAGILCNDSDLLRTDGELAPRGDPTEVALLVAGMKAGLTREGLLLDHHLVDEVPFESEHKYAASIYERADDQVVFVKGAPERIAEMCVRELSQTGEERVFEREGILARASSMADTGLRVLAMAIGTDPAEVAAARGRDPQGLTFVGLVGMLDPPREDAATAIAACSGAGIRVIMVTGDHERTARAIASRLGLDVGDVVGGGELSGLSDAQLDRTLSTTNVFARVSPGDKLRIVERLKDAGEIVAVTGDGVNDAPALKSAHVGAAMGRGGTDVAKEASSIVLADDNFSTIAAAAQEGRVAFGNIRKATFFLASSGVAELTAIIASLAASLPLPFLPAQILWLNVVTNGIEDVGLAFEPGEPGEFKRPPRPPMEGILSRLLVERLILAGLVMAIGTLGIFLYEWGGDPERLAYAQVAALSTMVAFQIFHVGNCRSEHMSAFKKSAVSNRFLFVGVAVTAVLHVAATYVPFTQTLLRLEPLELASWGRIVVVALSVILAMELHKKFRSRHHLG